AAPHHVAYREAFRILADDNECSRFFGGWPSLQALTLMTERMRSEALSNNAVGVRMSGYVTVFQNNLTGARFRIFEKVSVNSSGPLSRIPSARKLWVGRFPAGTKPAWVLILLHELGHLVRGADDKPLLPNDGGDPDQSDLNTRLVEARCDAQLNAVGF
ncbi:MAG TPA: hypothetical protein VGV38_09360, partial [Pyrinomonadaceae bacterium]|nr:hypothetical protein [Pyrinomonadaceae bacterium]